MVNNTIQTGTDQLVAKRFKKVFSGVKKNLGCSNNSKLYEFTDLGLEINKNMINSEMLRAKLAFFINV